ncbi:hypothetical protein [Saccharothrix luteola]|uniref:hypothetical protein n=1 Tax=Saccharothrix luteola TaxID=2893018 RepID=UPI001E28D793|nr:hypothetical protein [Saccharothrix luteola]MCC8249400.1 hypothetical protein [Saccharothrix luteola]
MSAHRRTALIGDRRVASGPAASTQVRTAPADRLPRNDFEAKIGWRAPRSPPAP